ELCSPLFSFHFSLNFLLSNSAVSDCSTYKTICRSVASISLLLQFFAKAGWYRNIRIKFLITLSIFFYVLLAEVRDEQKQCVWGVRAHPFPDKSPILPARFVVT